MDIVEFLLGTKEVGVDGPDHTGWTPLCIAAHRDEIASVKALVEHGADVSAAMA